MKLSVNDDFGIKSKYTDTSRWYVNRFINIIAAQLKPGLRVLDAGAGECAYKRYFSHLDYIATDLAVGDGDWNYTNLDAIARLHALCFQDESFDAVVCTQVLEHLEWPRESVKEFYRVLKPGGLLFITVPMSQNEHQVPYDFFRYTSFGIRSVCGHAGFAVIEVLPFGGLFTRWAYELPDFLSIFPPIGITKGTFRYLDIVLIPAKAFFLVLIRSLQAILFAFDRFDKVKIAPLGWSVIAEKPH
ncbi:MAG: class I SAM-dependent methyltransferase [Methylococcaceae bacterium]|nr:class I SAM-dependent methyltransferase [Methylococcaceae bacterium]